MRTMSILRPEVPITSAAFPYRRWYDTNIRETFERVRQQQAQQAAAQATQERRERRRKARDPGNTQHAEQATAAQSLPLFELVPGGTIPC